MYRVGFEEVEAARRVIESKQFFKINDGLCETKKCEEELNALFGCKSSILMTSGKAALVSALIGMGIGPGDEVIVPAYTYIATAIAVTSVGAIPVIAEIDETMTLDTERLEGLISEHTKAIIPVHIQGFPSKMDVICEIAKKHGLFVLEDSCQADGGSFKGKRLGTWGDAGALSFNGFKIISCGEGGALLTNNRKIFERALIYHDSSAIAYFGDQTDSLAEPTFAGTEFRFNELNSAVLREQLKRLDGILADLRRVRQAVIAGISSSGLRLSPSNDPEGDCATTLAFNFDSEAEARIFASQPGINGTVPLDTGKHVYSHWDVILEKRGALCDAMNPFKMPQNKGLKMNYSADMCPRSLSILGRTVYIAINPDWSADDIEKVISDILSAAKK